MRTTVDMRQEHRSALLALAAQRGEKGFSAVLAEAIEDYLSTEKKKEQQCQEFLALGGSLPLEEADELRHTTQALRASWR